MTSTQARFLAVRDRFEAALKQAGRSLDSATLVAVSKKHPAQAVKEIWDLGHRDFGENYVQELLEKAVELERMGCTGIRWHFLGHLQTNKVKALLKVQPVIHAVDSEKLAREISKRVTQAQEGSADASAAVPLIPVFLEVNLDVEATKSGVAPQDAPALSQALSQFPGLKLEGLMCIPAPGNVGAFSQLRELEGACRPATRGGLSMGMTQDFETAVTEGATHVRIGTAIFGERTK